MTAIILLVLGLLLQPAPALALTGQECLFADLTARPECLAADVNDDGSVNILDLNQAKTETAEATETAAAPEPVIEETPAPTAEPAAVVERQTSNNSGGGSSATETNDPPPEPGPNELWRENFESGGFTDWDSVVGDNWDVIHHDVSAHTGGYGADVRGNTEPDDDIITKMIDTSGWRNLELNLWFKLREGFEGTDEVVVEYTTDGGATWQLANTYDQAFFNGTEDIWDEITLPFPTGAANNPDFGFRFRAYLNGSTDRVNFDDLVLHGEPMSNLLTDQDLAAGFKNCLFADLSNPASLTYEQCGNYDLTGDAVVNILDLNLAKQCFLQSENPTTDLINCGVIEVGGPFEPPGDIDDRTLPLADAAPTSPPVLASPPNPPQIVWTDGFEMADLLGWATTTGSKWKSVSSAESRHYGSRGADVQGSTTVPTGDIITKMIDTGLHQNLVLAYWYKVRAGLEAGDHVYLKWTADDGLNWQTLMDYTELPTSTEWQEARFALPSAADGNPNFGFRFRAVLANTTDRMNFDDLVLSSTPGWLGGATGEEFKRCLFGDLNTDPICAAYDLNNDAVVNILDLNLAKLCQADNLAACRVVNLGDGDDNDGNDGGNNDGNADETELTETNATRLPSLSGSHRSLPVAGEVAGLATFASENLSDEELTELTTTAEELEALRAALLEATPESAPPPTLQLGPAESAPTVTPPNSESPAAPLVLGAESRGLFQTLLDWLRFWR